MPHSESHVATAKPAPYMKQLCKHFGHKVDATFDDASGSIEFTSGRVELDASAPGVLVLRVSAADAEALERTEQIVGSHLERFGRRDELSVSWSAQAAA